MIIKERQQEVYNKGKLYKRFETAKSAYYRRFRFGMTKEDPIQSSTKEDPVHCMYKHQHRDRAHCDAQR